jgi:dipeptidyl aminopeptidase/acylaminoacyl peptidase
MRFIDSRVVALSLARLARLASLASLAVACGAQPVAPSVAPTSANVFAAAGGLPAAIPTATGAHPFTVDDMLSFERIGDPTASPDGKLVAFTVSKPDLQANKMRSDVWLASVDGAHVRRATSDPASDHGARFAPDSKSLYFLSRRSGSSQVWRIAVDGGEATQVTTLPIDVEGVLPFPDGKRLLLIMAVFPDAPSLDETAKRDEAREKGKTNVRAYDALPVRHWDAWDEGKRSHLFVWSETQKGDPVDLLKGIPFDAPPGPFGGVEQIAIAPNGAEVAFTSKMIGKDAAWSTNSDVFVVPTDGSAKARSLTSQNAAEDSQPVFSPDGSKLAYLAMARAGFEADRRRVVVIDWKTKAKTMLTEAWDRSPDEITWSKDGRTIYATADNLGRHALFAIPTGAAGGNVATLVDQGNTAHVTVAGNRLVWTHDSLRAPAEVFSSDLEGKGARAITHLNDARVADVAWGDAEQISFVGAKGDKVYAWIVKPPGVKPGAKVPVAFLIHGGPQGSFGDHFHYRWNPQAYVGHGYAAVMVDFHGSTGYGQAFTDAIRGDWGGAPFEDLMKGLDAALAHDKALDETKMAALGASYGGYMINWINGKTDRFKALVCHDGNLDETMAYYDTEELWFPEWEHGGTPWENPDGYAKHSPISLVKNWKTPTLVVHGGRDFRVVDTQGLSTFTALQRRGVPSRFLYFPEENHWILKPLHTKRWHEEVLAWIDRYTRGT